MHFERMKLYPYPVTKMKLVIKYFDTSSILKPSTISSFSFETECFSFFYQIVWFRSLVQFILKYLLLEALIRWLNGIWMEKMVFGQLPEGEA